MKIGFLTFFVGAFQPYWQYVCQIFLMLTLFIIVSKKSKNRLKKQKICSQKKHLLNVKGKKKIMRGGFITNLFSYLNGHLPGGRKVDILSLGKWLKVWGWC